MRRVMGAVGTVSLEILKWMLRIILHPKFFLGQNIGIGFQVSVINAITSYNFVIRYIRKFANIQGKKIPQDFRSGQSPSIGFPLPVLTLQRFLPFCRHTRSLSCTRGGVRRNSV